MLTYHEIKGPGYDESGVFLYRGPKNLLKWMAAGSDDFTPHPATIEIKLDGLFAIVTLYNPEIAQAASFSLSVKTPLKVRPADNIGLRVES